MANNYIYSESKGAVDVVKPGILGFSTMGGIPGSDRK